MFLVCLGRVRNPSDRVHEFLSFRLLKDRDLIVESNILRIGRVPPESMFVGETASSRPLGSELNLARD